MSKIMIVDDEPEYVEMLSDIVTSFGHQVTKQNDPSQALKTLEDSNNFDLILSDIKMPQMLGTEFYKKYKRLPASKSKFVLMTGHSDFMGVEIAYALGVDELLAKPFDREILELVINYLLENPTSDSMNTENFFEVPIQDFIFSSKTDVFLHLKLNEKFICVAKTSQEFTAQRLNRFVSKGVTSVYLSKEDYLKYTDLQFSIAESIKSRPIDSAKKTKMFRQLLSSVSKSAVANSMDKPILQKALAAFESYTHLMLSSAQITELMTSLSKNRNDLAEHNALVAVIASGLTELWQWTSPKTGSRIIMGAMLCDMGLKNNPELLNKKKSDYNREELNIYENHPYAGYKMLAEMGDIPDEVLQIVLQHHENAIGTGFPQKVSRQKIHSYAKLIHGIHEFVEILMNQKNSHDIQEALDHLFKFQRKIVSEQVIKSLYLLFCFSVPKELESLQLPDKSGRLI